MEVNVRTVDEVTVVELAGEATWATTPVAEERILDQAKPGVKMCLDLSRVTYMSSAGLRLLLKIYRTISGAGGQVVLVGTSSDLRDTMQLTGFDFFTHYDELQAALAALNS
jgi:anti-sigma B factor antagonist